MSAEKNISWYVMRIRPVARLEFQVMHAINQREFPAMVPFKMEKVRAAKSTHWTERKRALFASYVFVGIRGYDEFRYLRQSINRAAEDVGKPPPIIGLIGFGGRLAKLSKADVDFLRSKSVEGHTNVDLYKPLPQGSKVTVLDGPFSGQQVIVDTATDEKVRGMAEWFGGCVVVELDRSNVVAA